MRELILAIDPGISGALAIMDRTTRQPVTAMRTPIIENGKGKRINGAAINGFLQPYSISHAFIEKVHAMPGQGGASMFSFGHSSGFVEGLVAGQRIPFTLVTPQAWKKHAGLIGTEKDAARSRAVQLFPDIRELDQKGAGQALADALLIGLYGITTL